MPTELINWLEIPVTDMRRARLFYEAVFQFKLVDMNVGGVNYPCFPTKDGKGYSGALVQYDFTSPSNKGPLIYLNSYGPVSEIVARIRKAGGSIIKERQEIAPGFGFFALFEDTEGNMMAVQGDE